MSTSYYTSVRAKLSVRRTCTISDNSFPMPNAGSNVCIVSSTEGRIPWETDDIDLPPLAQHDVLNFFFLRLYIGFRVRCVTARELFFSSRIYPPYCIVSPYHPRFKTCHIRVHIGIALSSLYSACITYMLLMYIYFCLMYSKSCSLDC